MYVKLIWVHFKFLYVVDGFLLVGFIGVVRDFDVIGLAAPVINIKLWRVSNVFLQPLRAFERRY